MGACFDIAALHNTRRLVCFVGPIGVCGYFLFGGAISSVAASVERLSALMGIEQSSKYKFMAYLASVYELFRGRT